jgi:hypothetical protein
MSGVWKRSGRRYWDTDGQDGPVTSTRPFHHRATPRLYQNPLSWAWCLIRLDLACPRGGTPPALGYRPGRPPWNQPGSPAPCPVVLGYPPTGDRRRAQSRAPRELREIQTVRREADGT